MYLIFAAHYNIRPCKAQYLYWYMEMLDKFPDAYFIINDDYLNPDSNRWEILERKKSNPNFKIKFPDKFIIVPCIEDFEDIKRKDLDNPASILRVCTKQHIFGLDHLINKILDNNKIDAAFTYCNNRTLLNTCKEHGIPVVHNERGPLRYPFFHNTFYFDFSGVNGDTEFYSRFLKFEQIADKVKIYSRDELLQIVTRQCQWQYMKYLIKSKPSYRCGVALQVDVDTNMVAYNKGWTSADLINKAMRENGKTLIRNHPLSSMQYATNKSLGNGVIDRSENSLEFISKCEKIMTINSSVAFEAMLMGKEVEILGDSPFAQISKMNEREKLIALNFAVFSYLVPANLWNDKDYCNFRITEKDEEVLYNKGQKLVMENRE